MGLFSRCEHEWESIKYKNVGLFSTKYLFQHKCGKCGKIEDCTLGYNEISDKVDDSGDKDRECFLCNELVYKMDKDIANECQDDIVMRSEYDEFLGRRRIKYSGEKNNITKNWIGDRLV